LEREGGSSEKLFGNSGLPINLITRAGKGEFTELQLYPYCPGRGGAGSSPYWASLIFDRDRRVNFENFYPLGKMAGVVLTLQNQQTVNTDETS
jgi:hypothetical protein